MKARALAAVVVAVTVAGCGSSSGSGVSNPTVAPAAQFTLANFAPSGPVRPGQPVTVSFNIKMPDGKTLTTYRTGGGPHTGVHLIIVRKDLGYIIHQHPPVQPSGDFTQTVTFPAPGPYKVLVDIYPKLPGVLPNFQLVTNVNVVGAYHPIKLPPFKPNLVVDGYHFDMARHGAVHAIQAEFLHVDVTDPGGQPAHFVPWFGALAHAIFFREGSLDYFHTHICAPSAPNCGTLAGAPVKIAGSSAAPGKLTVGVLLAVPGTWRLFLQMRAGSKIITAPYTLHVK
jgi:hypothetical protein